jgi:flavin reductase (DIM6/NTAB) family NADH-FMN oxidoreductase RutF
VSKKSIKTQFAKFQYFYPYTVALIGAKAKEHTNFMACAWHSALSFDPPLFGVLISKKRFTHQVIAEAKEFTVNFIRAEQALLSAQYGRKSGFDLVKTEKFPVKLMPSRIIQSPVIGDAYICFECRLIEIRTYGDHDLFVGEVLAIHEEENGFNEQGVLDPNRIHPLLYLGSDVYCTIDPKTMVHVLPE